MAALTFTAAPASAQPELALLELLHRASDTVLDRAAAVVAEAPLGGPTGHVHVIVRQPGDPLRILDALPTGVDAVFFAADGSTADTLVGAPDRPGAWAFGLRLGRRIRPVPGLLFLTTVPLDAKKAGRIGDYLLGDWPLEKQRAPGSSAYAPPRGLIVVTPANRNLAVSRHLQLGDLITKGQDDVWPKYVALTLRLLDKVEATLVELEAMGYPIVRAGVLSAFRSPWYNADSGPGDDSRHVYGDAVDLYIDNDGDGRMDDLNGDGRLDRRDVSILADAAERAESRYPELTGGIGVYAPVAGVHAGFVHIDARGVRARW